MTVTKMLKCYFLLRDSSIRNFIPFRQIYSIGGYVKNMFATIIAIVCYIVGVYFLTLKYKCLYNVACLMNSVVLFDCTRTT